MRDDDLDQVGRDRPETLCGPAYLIVAQSASPKGQRTRTVQTQHDHLSVQEHWFKVGGHEAAIAREGPREARDDVVERNVVVTWHDQARKRKRLEECPRVGEL